MLTGMTSTEYADWHRFCRTHYFQDTQLDTHLPRLTYTVLNLLFCDPGMHPSDFSLFVPRHEEEQVERPDEDKILMQKAAGLTGDVRSGGDGERDILSSVDVADVMMDDAALMMAPMGIPGGVRCVPVGRRSCY